MRVAAESSASPDAAGVVEAAALPARRIRSRRCSGRNCRRGVPLRLGRIRSRSNGRRDGLDRRGGPTCADEQRDRDAGRENAAHDDREWDFPTRRRRRSGHLDGRYITAATRRGVETSTLGGRRIGSGDVATGRRAQQNRDGFRGLLAGRGCYRDGRLGALPGAPFGGIGGITRPIVAVDRDLDGRDPARGREHPRRCQPSRRDRAEVVVLLRRDGSSVTALAKSCANSFTSEYRLAGSAWSALSNTVAANPATRRPASRRSGDAAAA
jgi:hypothetical protein